MSDTIRRPCPYCGADVFLVGPRGSKRALDVHETVTGPNRYRIDGGELVPVAEKAQVGAHSDHSETCTRQKGVVTHDGHATGGRTR